MSSFAQLQLKPLAKPPGAMGSAVSGPVPRIAPGPARVSAPAASATHAELERAARLGHSVGRLSLQETFESPQPGPTQHNVLQRVINPDWTAVTGVAKTKGSQVGVYFVKDATGLELVLKFEEDAAAEAFASEFIRNLGGNAPEVRLEDAGSDLIAQLMGALVKKCTPKNEPTNKNSIEYELVTTLGKVPTVLIMTKAPGVPMGEADKPDVETFSNPQFIESLGFLAAYDVALANYDRVLMGLNLGNILYDPVSGRTTAIDQTARENEMGVPGIKLVQDMVDAVLGGKDSSAWAQKIAKLIERLYFVNVSPSDLDTGFANGLLTIRKNLLGLVSLMSSAVGKAAGAQAGATAGRTRAYLEYLEPYGKDLQVMVEKRESDVKERYDQLVKVHAKPQSESQGISPLFSSFKFW